VVIHLGTPTLRGEEKEDRAIPRPDARLPRYNLYHLWYRFADATEREYLAEKVKRMLKRVKRK